MTEDKVKLTEEIRDRIVNLLGAAAADLTHESKTHGEQVMFKVRDAENKGVFDITVSITPPREPMEPVVMDQGKRDMVVMQLDELARKVQRGHNVPMAIKSHTIRPLARHANKVVHDDNEIYNIKVVFERPRGMPFIPGTALNVYPEGPSLGEKDES